MTKTRILPLCLLLGLAACARSEDASLVPPTGNQGYNEIGRVGNPEADDREPAIGQWAQSLQENAQVLAFGPLGTEPLFSLACTGNRSVLLQRHGGAPAGPLPELHVEKGDVTERFPVTMGGGTLPMLRAEMSLQSPLAEALGAQGEPLVIRLGDGAPMVLPANAMIGDYIRSCATARPPAGGAGANGASPAIGTVPANAAAPAANTAQPTQPAQ